MMVRRAFAIFLIAAAGFHSSGCFAGDKPVVLFLYDLSASFGSVTKGGGPMRTAIVSVLEGMHYPASLAFGVIGNCNCECDCRARPRWLKRSCSPPTWIDGAPTAVGEVTNTKTNHDIYNGYVDGISAQILRWRAHHADMAASTDLLGGLCGASRIFNANRRRRMYLVVLSDLKNRPAKGCGNVPMKSLRLDDVEIFVLNERGRGITVSIPDEATFDHNLADAHARPAILVSSGREIADAINAEANHDALRR
ncbi:MAG TPA: hypothetical protein VHZ29_05025 [Rhizomicrobium sp.]|jgi:hypothetical protein|nr:hypothetical protein [Rhizomicrobium sp.]